MGREELVERLREFQEEGHITREQFERMLQFEGATLEGSVRHLELQEPLRKLSRKAFERAYKIALIRGILEVGLLNLFAPDNMLVKYAYRVGDRIDTFEEEDSRRYREQGYSADDNGSILDLSLRFYGILNKRLAVRFMM